MAEKRRNPNNQYAWDHGKLKLSLNAVRDGYPSYERCHADKEECEGVSDDVVGGDAVHVSIVPQVVRVCKRGGLEIIHFFLVPTFQGSDCLQFVLQVFVKVGGRYELFASRLTVRTAKFLHSLRIASVDTVSRSQHGVCHLAEFVRCV